MKLITRDTDYAVRALCYMAKDPDRVTTVQELVDELDMPLAFSRRILQVLGREGILSSVKGKGGGFTISMPLNKIHLIEIMEAFQGKVSAVNCMFKKNICPNTRTCPLRGKMQKLERMVFSELQSITIASLLRGAKI